MGAANTSKTVTPESPSPSPKVEAQASFLQAITKERPISQPLELSCDWYIKYLDNKISKFWVKLFRPVLANVDRTANFPCNDDVAQAYRLLEVIIWQLEEDLPSGLALSDILDELYFNHSHLVILTDRERSHARLLVFAAFGWISECSHMKRETTYAN